MRYKTDMSKTLNVRFEDDLAKALEREARRTNRSKGRIVQDALKDHLGKARSRRSRNTRASSRVRRIFRSTRSTSPASAKLVASFKDESGIR